MALLRQNVAYDQRDNAILGIGRSMKWREILYSVPLTQLLRNISSGDLRRPTHSSRLRHGSDQGRFFVQHHVDR